MVRAVIRYINSFRQRKYAEPIDLTLEEAQRVSPYATDKQALQFNVKKKERVGFMRSYIFACVTDDMELKRRLVTEHSEGKTDFELVHFSKFVSELGLTDLHQVAEPIIDEKIQHLTPEERMELAAQKPLALPRDVYLAKAIKRTRKDIARFKTKLADAEERNEDSSIWVFRGILDKHEKNLVTLLSDKPSWKITRFREDK